jgi:hypothetical protein
MSPAETKRFRIGFALSIDIYVEIAEVATQKDRSMSAVAQRALTVAWPTLTTLPAGAT